VGRARELDLLEKALAAAVKGTGGCLVLEGPAGIGKSSLLGHAVDRARELELAVAMGRSTELDRVAPLTALLTALRNCQPPVLVGASLTALSRHDDSRFWLVDRLGELLESYSNDNPLLITLDDAQWIDELTALALQILIPLLRSSPILWLLARRPLPTGSPAHDAIDWLIAEGATRFTIGPLPTDATTQFCTDVLGAKPGPSVLELVTGADGNPFLLEELLVALAADGRIQIENGMAIAVGEELPGKFVTAVDHRLLDLSAQARQLLEAGSVLGRPFTLHEAAGLLEQSAVDLHGPIREAVGSSMLVDNGMMLAFRHDLIRTALYEALPGPVRQAMHRQAVTVLREEGRPVAEIAEHVMHSARRGDQEAITVLRGVATQVAPTAPGAAADLLLRMLDLLDEHDPERPRSVAEAVRLLASAGRLAEARRLGEAYLRRGLDAASEASILLGLAEALKHAGLNRSAVDYAQSALKRTGVPVPVQAHVQAILAHALLQVDDFAGADIAGEQAATLGRTVDEHAAVVFGMVARSVAAYAKSDLVTARGFAERSVQLADESGGEARHRHSRLWQARVLMATDQFGESAAVYAADQAEAAELGTAWSLPLWHHFHADLRIARGELEDAEAEAETGLRVAQQLGVMAMAPALLATLGSISLRRDELKAAHEYLRRAQHHAHAGIGVLREEMYWELAQYLEAAGRHAEAIESVAPLYDALPHRLYLFTQEPSAGPFLVRMALRAGQTRRAAAVVEGTRLVAERNPGVTSLVGTAAHTEGLFRNDLGLLREAAAAYSRSPRPLCRAEVLEDTAHAENAARNRDAAVELMEQALALYLQCTARRDASRIRRSLRTLGVHQSALRAPRRAKTGWNSLTESELRVARLVADGRTNRAIAEELFLSPHTVDSHIRHVFAKLAVSSRVELTRHVMTHDREH
jgi:DNA-binding CsgD family transcriptional regulator